MNLQEAYDAIAAVTSRDQAIFIATSCRWHNRGSELRQLSVEFQVSVVPGFQSSCDQCVSEVSLEMAVASLLAIAKEAKDAPATLETAEALLTEAVRFPIEEVAAPPLSETDVPF